MHCKSYSHFFSKKFQHFCVSLDVNFNELLTNDIVSFEQLGPDVWVISLISDNGQDTIKPGILSMKDKQVEAPKGEYNIWELSIDVSICSINIGNIIWTGAQQLS